MSQRPVDAASAPHAILRVDVPSADALRRMIQEPLAPKIEGSAPVRSAVHDMYFDTPAGTLERRGVTCRVRTFENGERSLAVAQHSPIVGVDGVPDAISEAAIEHHGEGSLFGDSEPERRLRQFVDPSDLAPTLEVMTERFHRRAPDGLLRRATVECEFETVTVRVGGRSRAFHEAIVRRIGESDTLAGLIAARWAEQYSSLSLKTTPFAKARLAAASIQRDATAASLGVDVSTVLIVASEGRVACLRGADGIRMPSRVGSGVASAERLSDELGETAKGLTRLRVTPPTASRALVEVWFANAVAPANARESTAIAWVPLIDLLAHAGAPFATDGPTLAALSLLIESSVADAILEGAPPPPFTSDLAVASGPATLNAELSLIDFNARVLTMAEDSAAALGDRIRLLAITCANADEFVMVRLAELRSKAATRIDADPDDGMSPMARFDAARLRLAALNRRQSRCFHRCIDALSAAGIGLRRWTDLDTAQQHRLRDWFAETIASRIATGGMTLILGHPFPRLPHLTLSLCVIGRERSSGEWRLSQFDLPRDSSRFVDIPETNDLIPLEEVARACAHTVHPDLEVDAVYVFRVIREGDLTLSEGDDLYDRVAEATRLRAFNRVVRVEVEREMPQPVRDALLATLQVEPGIADNALASSDLHASPGPLAIADAAQLTACAPARAVAVHDRSSIGEPVASIWADIASHDRMVHHPYAPYDATVLRYFGDAAADPLVRAIWVTLYRVGEPSPVVDALLAARAAGKSVSAYVELTARFDETRNLSWVERLEEAGVSVAYGRGDLKCHAKVALVERWEDGAVHRYAHVGTGNYNVTSARMYTDFSLLTADPRITSDLRRFIDWLVGDQAGELRCEHCLVAPTGLLSGMLARIEREIAHARAGRAARIRLKLNALSERELVSALYRASQAGVEMDLVVRGICTLRPGVPGLSDRIRVASRIGRFLEHGRIYHFANGGDDEYFLGSADWRPRNMRRRVEVVVPVFDADARAQLGAILDTEIADPARWRLDPSGVYAAPSFSPGPSADEQFAARE